MIILLACIIATVAVTLMVIIFLVHLLYSGRLK